MLALRLSSSTTRSAIRNIRLMHSTPRMQQQFLNVDADAFLKAIQAKDKVVLVDFYADWCGPCRTLSPILTKLAGDESTKTGSGLHMDLVTVDTDEHGELAAKYGVRGLPTVVAFKDGEPISQFVGALPEGKVRAFLKDL